jgi:hypothetical protein
MKPKILSALEDCLQEIRQGDDLDTVLARHPDVANELRPLLVAAQAAGRYDQEAIPAQVVRTGRARLVARVDEARRKQRTRMVIAPFRRFASAVALVLVCSALAGTGLVTVSASSLPGDALYGIKRTTENVQLQLAFNDSQRTALQDQFSIRRVDEAQTLLIGKRIEQVEFNGQVNSRLTDGWLVSGINVIVDTQTELNGDILPGEFVEVVGITQANDSVLAVKISVESAGEGSGDGTDNSGSAGGQGESGPSATGTPEPTQWEGSPTQSATGSGGGGWNENATHQSNSDDESESRTGTPRPTRTPGPTSTPGPTGTPGSTSTKEPED